MNKSNSSSNGECSKRGRDVHVPVTEQEIKAPVIQGALKSVEAELDAAKKEAETRTTEYDRANTRYNEAKERLRKIEEELGKDLHKILVSAYRGDKDSKDEFRELTKNDKNLKYKGFKWLHLKESELPSLKRSMDRAFEISNQADRMVTLLQHQRDILFNKVCDMSDLDTNAWSMLRECFPERVFERVTPQPGSTLMSVNFPLTPLKVFNFQLDKFVKLCTNLKLIDGLKKQQIRKGMALKLHFHVLGQQSIVGRLEQGSQGFVQSALSSLFSVCNSNGVTEDATVFGQSLSTIGNMYFELGKDNVESGVRYLLIAGEVKRISVDKVHLAGEYCDHGCSKKDCQSQRHNKVSTIRQLYNYMVLNGLFFGLLTTYETTWGFIRDCKGNLAIIPGISSDQTSPISISQFIVLFFMLAAEKKLPECIGEYTDKQLVQCTEKTCSHQRLPNDCNVRNKDSGVALAKDDTTVSGNQTIPFYQQGGNLPISILDLQLGEPIDGGYRSDSTRRASLPNGTLGIVKINDIFKTPEIEDEMTNEAKIYHHLGDLQGNIIPKLLGHGRFMEGFLFGLMTSDAGREISSSDSIDDAFVDKAVAGLKQIHAKGVLHKDIRKPNILRNQHGNPVIINFNLAEIVDLDVNDPDINLEMEREIQILKQVFKE